MDGLFSLVVPVGLSSLFAVLVTCVTKVLIVKMSIRDVPPEHRADVLRAAGALFRRESRHGREDTVVKAVPVEFIAPSEAPRSVHFQVD